MKPVKTINKKYGVPTSKPRNSEILRVSERPMFTQTAYTPKKVTIEADDIEANMQSAYIDPVKTALWKGEIGFTNMIGRIERSLKRMKVVSEYTPDGYFQIWIDNVKTPEMYTYYIGTDHTEKYFTVLDVEEREIMCVDNNELIDIMEWLRGFNDIEGRGKLLLRTDLID